MTYGHMQFQIKHGMTLGLNSKKLNAACISSSGLPDFFVAYG